MAEFNLSAVITADNQASPEIRSAKTDLEGLATANDKVSKSARSVSTAEAEATRALQAEAAALTAIERAANPAIGSHKALAAALERVQRDALEGKVSMDAYAEAQRRAAAGAAAFTAAGTGFVRSAGATRQATQQLGVQVNDFATQVSLGASPLQAFNAQIGQVGFAMSQMGGKVGAVGAFLGGPWGAAVLIATTILVPFIGRLFEADEALDKTKLQLDRNATAAQIHAATLEELIKAIEDQDRALGNSIATGRAAEEQTLRVAEAARQEIIRRREATIAILEEAKAREALFTVNLRNQLGAEGSAGFDAAEASQINRRLELETELAKQNAALAKAQNSVIAARIPILQRDSEARTDPSKKIADDFEKRQAELNRQLQARTISEARYNRDLDAARVARKAAEEGLRSSSRTPRATSGDAVTPALVSKLLKDAFGGTITSTTGGKHTDGSYHYSGQAVDFVPRGGVGAVSKGQIREVLQGAGINIKELLGPGDKEHSDHFHAAFGRTRTSPEALERREAAQGERLEDFGTRAATTLAQLGNRTAGLPQALQQANAQLIQLDALLAEIEERKPPNLAELKTDAEAARVAIQAGIQDPYNDFIAAQVEGLAVQRLVTQGREDEAEALQIIVALEKQQGPLNQAQKAAILATVQARKAETREASRAREEQLAYLDALASTRDAIRGIFEFSLDGLKALPGRLFASFEKLMGDRIFASLGLDTIFQELEDQTTGAKVVKDASAVMSRAVNAAAKSIAKLGDAAEGAAGGVPGTAQGDAVEGEIVVTGEAASAIRDPAAYFAKIVEKLAGGILGQEFAATLGKIIGNAFEGAGIGRLVASITGGNKTGSTIGGAVGNVLGKELGGTIAKTIGGTLGKTLGGLAGPLGSIAGSLLGGAIGGLLAKPKFGSSTVTGVNNVNSISGNNKGAKNASGALGNSVQSGLSAIADQLGASIGDFSVSIGVRDDKFRVDPTGSGKTKKSAGALDFGKDQAAAVAAAIADALADGAIRNLSPAVAKALNKYGNDIDRSLREAVKVQDLETLIAGVGGKLNRVFADFERVAGDRVRIAKEYGLDLLKVEKLNAEERAETFAKVMEDRIGPLRSLLDDLAFGNLSEGTLLDKRQVLLGKVSAQQTAAEAGTEGAASKLADLERQLVELSREAFGTAGPEYGTDRANAIAAAEKVIAQEEQRAREAQDRATAALTAAQTSVALQNEGNALTAETNALLRELVSAGGGFQGGGLQSAPSGIGYTFRSSNITLV